MNELHAVLNSWREAKAQSQQSVLATVVHVTGSAYRRPGARMLIREDGRRVGTISGGCLEDDVSRKAWWFTEDGKPTVRVYDTSSDSDAVWEFGLGCNGVIHVLLERTNSASCNHLLEFLDLCGQTQRRAVVATVVAVSDASPYGIADRWFVDDAGAAGGGLHGSPVEAELRSLARAAFAERRSSLVHLGTCDVLIEFIAPPLSLVIFGAGHDAVPVCAIAAQLGWHVTVADGRPAYARADRFPGASSVVVIKPGEPLASIAITSETAVLMMTHNFPFDQRVLPGIIAAKPLYTGMLGPRKRAESLFEELGLDLDASDIHAPVGLDIGGDAPEAIALSIVAEIQTFINGRHGGKLRYRDAPIHEQVHESGPFRGLIDATQNQTQTAVCEVSAW